MATLYNLISKLERSKQTVGNWLPLGSRVTHGVTHATHFFFFRWEKSYKRQFTQEDSQMAKTSQKILNLIINHKKAN